MNADLEKRDQMAREIVDAGNVCFWPEWKAVDVIAYLKNGGQIVVYAAGAPEGRYYVTAKTCTCRAHQFLHYPNGTCKHIRALQFALADLVDREEEEASREEDPLSDFRPGCPRNPDFNPSTEATGWTQAMVAAWTTNEDHLPRLTLTGNPGVYQVWAI